MSEKMELISFKLCPFVQRAVIVLKYKQIDFDITYIDLGNPPGWFKEISPLGQVPVLKVGSEVLFESSVIQEYVDEVTPPSLHPTDSLIKAKNRAWISYSGELIMDLYKMGNATSDGVFTENKEKMLARLKRLESMHSGTTFFNNDDFALIDAAVAPFFMRLALLSKLAQVNFLEGFPKMTKWSNALLALESVQKSVVDDFPQMYTGMLKNVSEGYVASL